MYKWLNDILDDLEQLTGNKYNNVMITMYIDGEDCIQWHKDEIKGLDLT